MPNTHTSFVQRIIQILAVFGIFGMSTLGIQLLAASPCDIPRTWSVGRVDPQFNLSKQAITEYGKKATGKWNEAYEKNPLFIYRENGGEIVLNFVYDERMQTTIRNQRLKRSITERKEDLISLKENIEDLREEYATLERTIESLTEAYDSRLSSYNKEVAYWNSRGGAPKEAYDRLEESKLELENERLTLNTKINYFNQLGYRIRTYGESHNEIVEDLNEKIVTLNESAGQEFEEGIYDPNDNSITVYEYASPIALQRVLTHEFGHALSIGHVNSEDSIMYAINQGKSLDLSQDDLAELELVCQERKLNGLLRASTEAIESIRGGISRLVGLS